LGRGLFVEPALKVSFADGNRDLVLHYQSHTVTANAFDVLLKDIDRPSTSPSTTPSTPTPASWPVPRRLRSRQGAAHDRAGSRRGLGSTPAHYTLNYLTGRWAGEWSLTQEKLDPGARVIESRRGSTGHQANPWFAIQAGSHDENHGEVWFGALAWAVLAHHRRAGQLDEVRVTGGFNPFDFGSVLHPGQSLETPVFYGGYAQNGLGGASRLLHRFELAHILPRTQATASQPCPSPAPSSTTPGKPRR